MARRLQGSPQSDWDQIAEKGYLEAPAPNPDVAPLIPNNAGLFPGDFAPGAITQLGTALRSFMRRQALPGTSGIIDDTEENLVIENHWSVFDNRFLLGLRTSRHFIESSAAEGSSAPGSEAIFMGHLRPRFGNYRGMTTRWPAAPIVWPTFSGDEQS